MSTIQKFILVGNFQYGQLYLTWATPVECLSVLAIVLRRFHKTSIDMKSRLKMDRVYDPTM